MSFGVSAGASASASAEVDTGVVAKSSCVFACNFVDSKNVYILVRTRALTSMCEDEVVEWVRRCLSDKRFDKQRDSRGRYPWNIVSNVLYEGKAEDGDGDGDGGGLLRTKRALGNRPHLRLRFVWVRFGTRGTTTTRTFPGLW